MLDPQALANQKKDATLHPQFWDRLSTEEKTEFITLRAQFRQNLHTSVKDRRVISFANELIRVLQYIERDKVHKEERSILTGVCFAGPLICVNTRQLKTFLCRCKSSINGSFQQMGYVALRTKAKARQCIVTLLPALQNEQTILRQWTVRRASENADFCFLSSFPISSLPEITDEDLVEEMPKQKTVMMPLQQGQVVQNITAMKRTQSQHIGLNTGRLNSISSSHQSNSTNPTPVRPPIQRTISKPENRPSMSTAYSLQTLNAYADPDWDLITTMNPILNTSLYKNFAANQYPLFDMDIGSSSMTRSVSASLDVYGDWCCSQPSEDYTSLADTLVDF